MKERFKKEPEMGKVIGKMCNYVGANPNKINFLSPYWYEKYSWKEEDQEDFIKWLTDYFYKRKEARKELLRTCIKTKKEMNKASNEFVLKYGWKVKKQ